MDVFSIRQEKVILLFSIILVTFLGFFVVHSVNAEGNSSAASAIELVDTQEISTNFNFAREQKWYKIEVPNESSIISTISSVNVTGIYELYDANLVKIRTAIIPQTTIMIGEKVNSGIYYIRIIDSLTNSNYSDNSMKLKVNIKEEDNYENNDTAANAKLITPGKSMVDMSIEASNDEEWFKVELDKTSSIINTMNINSGVMFYHLFDSNMKTLQSAYISSTSKMAGAKLKPGIYYIRLSYFTDINFLTNSLSLKVDIKDEDSWENNDTVERAAELTSGQEVSEVSIEAPNDKDWFKVNLSRAGKLNINLSTNEWIFYALYDENLKLVKSYSFHYGNPYNFSHTLPGGIYYIRLSNYYTVTNNVNSKINFTPRIEYENAVSGIFAKERIKKLSSTLRDSLSFVSDPVDAATGAQVFNYNLLNVNGAVPLSFEMNYNSLLTNKGALGIGWEHNYETKLVETSEQEVEIQWSANRKNKFLKTAEGPYLSEDLATKHDTLVKQEDGSFLLTGSNQKKYIFDSTGKLIKEYSKNGQVINYEYTSTGELKQVIEPISMQSIQFEYNSDGMLQRVVDKLNREIIFVYDNNHHLLTFTTPKGDTTSFTYNEFGWILNGYKNDIQFLANKFDVEGRVIEQDDAKPGNELTTFAYDEITQPGKLITTVKDRTGNTKKFTHDPNYQLLSITDELNNVVVLNGYDEKSNLVTKTDGNGNKTLYTYDDKGNMLTETDPSGNVTTLSYDDKNNLVSSVNANGGELVFTYDSNNNVLSKTDENDGISLFTYDENGLLSTETDPLKRSQTYAYVNGLLSSVTDSLGNQNFYEYDAVGRITKTTDAEGNITTLFYDHDDNIIKKVDALGNVSTYSFDHNGNKLSETDSEGNIIKNSYNTNGKLLSSTDPLGHVTQYDYDGEDRPIKVTYPDGSFIQKGYDPKGRVIKETDQLGRIHQTKYDLADNIVEKIDPLGNSLKFIYDRRGNITKEVNQLGNPVQYQYDALSQMTKRTQPDGNFVSYRYDLAGNLIEQVNTIGEITTFQYNPGQELTKKVQPGNRIEEYSYDLAGNLTSLKQADGTTKSFEYDAINQLTSVTDPNGHTTSYSYDAVGNRIKDTNSNSHIVSYRYNSKKLLVEEIDALGNSTKYNYNAAGNLVSKIDAKGQETSFTYDEIDNLVSIQRPDNSLVQYVYDKVGNRISMTDSTGETTYLYDNLNQLVEANYPGELQILYAYDASGNKRSLTYPDSTTIQFEYDSNNRLIKTTDWMGRTSTSAYDPRGLIQNEVFPNGMESLRSYNSAGELLSVSYSRDATVIKQRTYTYDSLRNRTSETDELGRLTSFTYDKDQQLTEVVDANGITTDYTYDKIGNRVSQTKDTVTSTYTYDEAERLTSVEDGLNVITPFTFDPNGNLVQQGERQYSFDAENNLTKVVNDSGQVDYLYDGDNSKVGKIVDGTTTRYIYDIVNGLPQLLLEVDQDGNITKKYYPNTTIQVKDGQEIVSYHLVDGLGSIIGLTDQTARVVSEYTYDSFGQILTQTGEVDSDFKYVGEQQDSETSLIYLRARHYDPVSGRFLSEDPFNGVPTDPRSLNKYSYAYNNPVNLTDPSGKNPFLVKFAVDAVIGVGVDYLIQGDEFSFGKSLKTNSISSIGPGSNGFKKGKELLSFVQKSKGTSKLNAPAAGDNIGKQLGKPNENPLTNIQYTDKVKNQMQQGDFHSFPTIVDRYGGLGKIESLKGGDDIMRTRVNISGGYKGREGVFEYIIEPDGKTVNHRLFRVK